MKKINIDQFIENLGSSVKAKETELDTRKKEIEAEITSLRSQLDEAEKALENDADTAAFKKAFRKVADLKIEIEADEALLDRNEKGRSVLSGMSRDAWYEAVKQYNALITPILNEYNKEKKRLLNLYISILQDQGTVINALMSLEWKYKKDDLVMLNYDDIQKITTAGAFPFFCDVTEVNDMQKRHFLETGHLE